MQDISYTNLRLGMFLEVATTIGAIIGAIIATKVSVKALTIFLAIILLYSARNITDDCYANYTSNNLIFCFPVTENLELCAYYTLGSY